jgi:hypothetical protein
MNFGFRIVTISATQIERRERIGDQRLRALKDPPTYRKRIRLSELYAAWSFKVRSSIAPLGNVERSAIDRAFATIG